eukprot:TRINITY_DN5981_c0_g1_i1.p1 TRINITY_DN5981_c0_g1~~TRINITY_DN5981_c0_g1_i1.p1  ORF type:complete len:498 (+),score=85.02 TRINITY_DN5981_c0_g1_i1:94-1587(+)
MSVRGLTPIFKWGFGFRRSTFLVPIISNNILVSGEEAVAQGMQPALPLINFAANQKEESTLTIPKRDQEIPKVAPEIQKQRSYSEMSDEEIIQLVEKGKIPSYRLEQDLQDLERAVSIRRALLEKQLHRDEDVLKTLPYESYDYSKILGQCCENVIGYVSVPVGIAGPIMINGESITVPMATTEGALIASTHRGCKAISSSGGAFAAILSRGMTRAPVVKMPSLEEAVQLKEWLDDSTNLSKIMEVFNSTSRFGQLKRIKAVLAGRNVFMRFKSETGDAMGMNIVSKGVEKVLAYLQEIFPQMIPISVSGNMCTDKKPSAINWIDGRGRSVVCEAIIKASIVESVLKTNVDAMVQLNVTKNLVGSAMAASIGGFNAHAANIVSAIFLATGQDIAQNVDSSNCITLMEQTSEGDLQISVTMPSIEVGTIGGGTTLPAQSTCLDILNAKGPSSNPGQNADRLARIICATVLAGELSLMAALSAGHLMRSHLSLNRKPTN